MSEAATSTVSTKLIFRSSTEGEGARDGASEILAAESFRAMLRIERKRTERSERRFVLVLVDSCGFLKSANDESAFQNALCALAASTRETDIKGWYEEGSIIGIIFTEVGLANEKSVTNALSTKISNALASTLSIEQLNQVSVSFHVYPEQRDEKGRGTPSDPTLYPDLQGKNESMRAARLVKRAVDIAGSLFALILSAPLLIVISAAIKLTSKGPILFRQERVGQNGKPFTFLKFRSMHSTNDHTIHKEYVKRLIAGATDTEPSEGSEQPVYKLTNDSRVTALGRLLRRASLDEFPQFLNVLRGEMSLVGPRPPIPYEFDSYRTWHKQRVMTMKPGITGLWQVRGRSRTKFDQMVRLDLKYAESWCLWLDLKILLQTPRAVVSGEGAY
jgi:lipopolysaccharide/colanic/teichoic acid biosynthesis glycosyltransferase